MGKNKFWKGVIMGAVAGGMLSLLDRETRQVVGEKCGRAAKGVAYVVTHPKETVDTMKKKSNEIRVTVNQMSEDISYIVDKIEEVRELTPEVAQMVKETKEVFMKEDEQETI
jgi:gas vesicle protein